MARLYENFDVEIIHDGDGYAARIRSPCGEARAPFGVPLSQQEVRILGLTVARGRKTTRSVQTREVDEVKAYGQRLFDSLFTGDVLACYHESLAQVRGKSDSGLRVRLRLGDTPELAQVPWEYLFDRRNSRFLALEDETPIVRYLDMPLPAGALTVEPPLRVLVMISGPNDMQSLDANAEWERLHDALADLVQQGAVKVDRLEKATLSALRWKLKAEDYHVFHFIGHGGVDALTDRGVLILEDDTGRSDVVEAETIAGILSSEKTLRLAVVNACEGGRASKGDIFAGTAQTLVQHDVPAVIAMQFEISDDAAITLTHDFYKSLAFGDPVDAALTEARRGLRYEKRNELEWGTPVLYMRAADGRLFNVKGVAKPVADAQPKQPPPPPPSKEPVVDHERERRSRVRRISDLLHEGQIAAYSEKWSEAAMKFKAVLDIDPDNEEALTRLEALHREEQLAVLQKKQQKSKKKGAFVRVGKFVIGAWVLGAIAFVIMPKNQTSYNPQTGSPTQGTQDTMAFLPSNDTKEPEPAPQQEKPTVTTPIEPTLEAPSRDQEAANLGLSRYGSPQSGSLAPGQEVVHDVALEGGQSFIVAGSCDANCSNLDLRISEQGVTKVQDATYDRLPSMLVVVLYPGTYQLTVSMSNCAASTCAYRVQVYRR